MIWWDIFEDWFGFGWLCEWLGGEGDFYVFGFYLEFFSIYMGFGWYEVNGEVK